MSNFGLTYRNSKWSDYALTNVSLKSKTSFVRFVSQLLLLAFTLLVLVRGLKFYNDDLLNNDISFLLWTLFDATKYGACFVIWSTLFFIKSTITHAYSRVFATFYGINHSTVRDESTPTTTEFNEHMSILPKSSQKLVFYSWLTSTNSNSHQSQILEHLYATNPTQVWETQSQFFKSLFQASNSVILNDEYASGHASQVVESQDHTVLDYLTNSTNLRSSVTLNTNLKLNESTTSVHTTLQLLNSRTSWNLYAFETELDNYNPQLKSIKGLFYLYDVNFNKLSSLMTNHSELGSLMNSISDQSKMFKWNRWLYRYNILHRKLMKNSHKTTLAKKLISTGFLDSSLMERNLWASDFFSKQKKPNKLISSTFNSLYGNSLNLNDKVDQQFMTLDPFSTKNTSDLLNSYENSYFYFIKRFHLFNTMSTNKINSSVNLTSLTKADLRTSVNTTENLISNHQSIISNLIKSKQLTNAHFDPTNIKMDLMTVAQDGDMGNKPFFKDLINVNSDNDLLNSDNLEILSNLSNSLTANNYQYNYYNPSNYNAQVVDLDLSFSTTNTSSPLSLTPYHHFLEKPLLMDIFVLTRLIK